MSEKQFRTNDDGLLSLSFLGSFQVKLNHEPVTNFGYDKVRALLAYLALESSFPQRREVLIAIFWPDQAEIRARKSLNQALYILRKALGDNKSSEYQFVIADRMTVQLNPKANVSLDVVEFDQMIHASLNGSIFQRQEAIKLYKGDFLKGLSLDDSLAFDEWVVLQRERLHRQAMEVLDSLVRHFTQQGDWQQALIYGRRQEEMEPWREETHRQLMILLAQTGQRSAALRQYEKCQIVLRQELGITVSPETEVISERIKRQVDFSLNNLPTEITAFIGREKELNNLTGWLTDTAIRALTITGSGGIGKTRLALAAAKFFIHPTGLRPLDPFRDGVYFIDLVPLSKPDQIELAIAEALHFNLQSGGGRSHLQQLQDYLTDKHMLLILDNFEHLLPGATRVASLLQAAPKIKILVTSRGRLQLRSESNLQLSGLTYQGEGPDVEDINNLENDAARLFINTAKKIQPQITFNDTDTQHINRICKMVEGLPLAIELSAMWVDTFSIATIADEIESGIEILEKETYDMPERHRSIQAVFSASWRRLPNGGKTALARLSIFQGGFTLEAARAITDTNNQTLAILVRRSLLQFYQPDGRYHFHELLRQFAAGKLAKNHELEWNMRQKHLAFYGQLAKKGQEQLQGGEQIKWMKRFNKESGNMRAAFDWGFDHDLEQAAQLAIHQALFWFYSGQAQMGQQTYKAVVDRKADLMQLSYGWALTWYTAMLWVQGDLEKSKILAEEAQRLFEQTDDAAGLLMSYYHLAVPLMVEGDFVTALRIIDQAIQIAHVHLIPTTYYLSACLQAKTSVLIDMGDLDYAQAIITENYALVQERRDIIVGIYVLNSMAYIHLKQGDLNAAKELYQKCLASAQDLNERRMEAAQYRDLGEISLAEGDIQPGIDQLETAAAISEVINSADILVDVTRSLGDIYLEAASYDFAMKAYQRSAVLSQQMNNPVRMSSCLEQIAKVRWQQQPGNLDSVRWLAVVYAWHESAGERHNQADHMPNSELLETIRKHLPEDDFGRAWQAGLSLTVNEGLAEAIRS